MYWVCGGVWKRLAQIQRVANNVFNCFFKVLSDISVYISQAEDGFFLSDNLYQCRTTNEGGGCFVLAWIGNGFTFSHGYVSLTPYKTEY